ncbi:TCP-1/cpn60 chaperonin family protein [Bacillaceae bacterium]
MSASREKKGEGDERLSALVNNANAVRAVASAIEGTIGPKGLDTMLVDDDGEVIITNDGVTILEKMDVKHPAAKMLIHMARAQEERVGDGTTTATILASALVAEGVNQVNRGVPVAKVIAGIREGIGKAVAALRAKARPVESLDDPVLHRIALIAGREHEDIAELVLAGAKRIGMEKLKDPAFKFADMVIAQERAANEVIPGILINKMPVSRQMPQKLENVKLLVVDDALAPEELDEEAMGTETGFATYLRYKEQFAANLEKIAQLGVKAIIVDRSADRLAEEFCTDKGILLLHRVAKKDIEAVIEHTGALPLKRTGLNKPAAELVRYLGVAASVSVEAEWNKVRILGGKGVPVATMIVGASTVEVVGERERIAKDAAASLQAAVRGGFLPGGGSVEVAIARELERERETVCGLEGFGLAVVASALRRPMWQMIANAGFNPLEKMEEVKAAQAETGSDALGIDYDTGRVADMLERGVVDPLLVKVHALQAAGEVSEAILRIHTIVKMRSRTDDGFE